MEDSALVTLSDVVNKLSLDVTTCPENLQSKVGGAYVSDLLSDVMANSKEGDIWITLQTHMNIVAVASLKKISGIIVVGGRMPNIDVLDRAKSEGITIMTTKMPAFDVAGMIYQRLKC